ncbi:MAG: DNA/RNA nuclease SfsA [Bdellovibrionales bacterium]|nr:DNA/RNA nuclease SfsA [Bdellovibrionales bacterium]
MKFTNPVHEARFLKRYKRFFADVRLDGEVVVAHVPNTGSLKTCLFEDSPCIVTKSDNPARKLKATLHFVKAPTSWIGVDTSLPNLIAFEAWEEQRQWTDFKAAKREYKISKETRLDFVLAKDEAALAAKRELHHVEIKNVTLADGTTARFPDAVTERGQKHLRELMELVKQGHTAEILFVVQRQDCTHFAPADDIDPEYGRLLRAAHAAGVTVRALSCEIEPLTGVRLSSTTLELTL